MTAAEVDAALEPTREQIKAAQEAYAEAIAGRPEFVSPYWISWNGMKAALTAARVVKPDPNAIEAAARVLFMRYYMLRDDASEEWAEMYWRECANLPHKGDCPHAEHKGPITCDRCVCDEFRRDAAEVLAAVAAARVAEPDPNALPMDELPEGWAFCRLEQWRDDQQTWYCQLIHPNYMPTPMNPYPLRSGRGPTPRAAFLAVVAAAREG